MNRHSSMTSPGTAGQVANTPNERGHRARNDDDPTTRPVLRKSAHR